MCSKKLIMINKTSFIFAQKAVPPVGYNKFINLYKGNISKINKSCFNFPLFTIIKFFCSKFNLWNPVEPVKYYKKIPTINL